MLDRVAMGSPAAGARRWDDLHTAVSWTKWREMAQRLRGVVSEVCRLPLTRESSPIATAALAA